MMIPEYRALVLKETNLTVSQRTIETPELGFNFYQENIKDSPRFTPGVENFIVLLLNTRRRVIGWQVLSTGTLDTILVHPREVFRVAIIANASAMIIMHNHPSGDPTPSDADVRVTRDLIRAGQLLNIEVLDHLVCGDFLLPNQTKQYSSLRELGYFYV
jgi:DNA repair protein RadC